MKKLLVVLSIVLVLAFAGGVFASSTGHVGHETSGKTTEQMANEAMQYADAADVAALNSALGSTLGVSIDVVPSGALSRPSAATERTNLVAAGLIAKVTTSYLTHGRAYPLRVGMGATKSQFASTSRFVSYINSVLKGTGFWKLAYMDASGTAHLLTASDFYNGTVTNGNVIFWIFVFNTSDSTTGVGEISSSAAPATIAPELYISDSTEVNIGSSGGGCVAGTSALALAVLGLFIAKGKK